MRRFWIVTCLVCGAVLVTAALLVPAYSRALEAKALEAAGARTVGLIEEGITLVRMEKSGPARMLFQAAQAETVRDADRLAAAINQFNAEHPDLAPWGGANPSIEKASITGVSGKQPVPIVELLMQREVREKLLDFLRSCAARRPGLAHFLNNRLLTNTVHFPAATSASGQAFDGAVIIAGLLYQGDHLTTTLRDTLEFLAMKANRGENPESLEMVYLDLLSLGKRVDWVSLVELMKKVEDLNTLRMLAEASRGHEEQFAALFAAVQVSNEPGQVGKYLERFPDTGVNDLSFASKCGAAGTEMLLKHQHQIYYPGKFRTALVSYNPFGAWFDSLLPLVQSNPRLALLLKYGLLLLGAMFLARLVGYAAGQTQWYGLRFSADTVTALAITFIIGLCSEPFVGLPSQIHNLPIRFSIPVMSVAPGSTLFKFTSPLMNNSQTMSLLPLIIFFVIQALIYVWCLSKLNEIRRQPLGARMKLKLLENEDHLFDAGLYMGLLGTIIALILFFLGVPKFSVMSAYASTSFGITFVVILKIFHIRPFRRKLIIESEVAS